MMQQKLRCGWATDKDERYTRYHDEEWGIPVYDDRLLFEMLILEGAQAGLSWQTVLNKREGYRKAFKGFNPRKVAVMTDCELEAQLKKPDIVRNRLKVFATRKNAIVFLDIQHEQGSFADYLWRFVDNQPIINRPASMADVPVTTELSDRISKDLKKRGMTFVGSTIIYAYLQAVGVVNDHTADCFCAMPAPA
ncbi:MAG: DNA-3-methyladenine glycosylase I [Marinobacterium sp.]|nr:DNA-3-methyladenine glycosylase I [Marinobacterium sp.]